MHVCRPGLILCRKAHRADNEAVASTFRHTRGSRPYLVSSRLHFTEYVIRPSGTGWRYLMRATDLMIRSDSERFQDC